MGGSSSRAEVGSPVGSLLEAWDRNQLPVQAGMKKKRLKELCKKWALLKDEHGRQIWPESGTFEFKTLKALRSRIEPTQLPYWYCWAEMSRQKNPIQVDLKPRPPPYNPEPAFMAPLLSRPVPGRPRGQTGHILTHTPFSPSDLVIWKKETPSFRADPQAVVETIRSIVDTHNPSWADMTQLLHVFLTKDELMKLFEKTEEIARRPVINAPGQVTPARVAWPLNRPDWDYNNQNHWDDYTRAKINLMEALQEIGKKPLNWTEFQKTMQRDKETPDAFWVRLLEAGTTFAHLDIGCQKDQSILAAAFVNQSASDIRGHFHKIVSNWSTLDISELRRIANFVFDQRERLAEEERERKEAEREREKEKRRRTERREDLQAFAMISKDNRRRNYRRTPGRIGTCRQCEMEGRTSCWHCFRCGKEGHTIRHCGGDQSRETRNQHHRPRPPFPRGTFHHPNEDRDQNTPQWERQERDLS